jgi:hypothetical protein
MGPCPCCAAALEVNQGVLFCPACKLSLHERASLAYDMGLSPDEGGLEAQVDRLAEPVGTCPGCQRGDLLAGRLAGERVAQCAACGALWVGGAALARVRAAWIRRGVARDPIASRPVALESSTFEYDTPQVNALALPAALTLGVLAQLMGFEIFVFATTGMWAHELGHALVAWLSGFVAIPLPFVTLRASEDRSFLGAAVLMLAIAAGGYFALRKRAWALLAFLAGLAVLQGLLTLVLNPAQATKWVIFAGLGGELVLPTVWIAAFYQRLPGRWDFWRYPVLAASAVTLVRGVFLWTRVASGARAMPHGSMVGSDSEGDVERLVRFYHFSEPGLAQMYLTVAWGCLAILACVYAFRLRVSLARR